MATQKCYRFRSIHTVMADSEEQAWEELIKQYEDFVNNAVIIAVEERKRDRNTIR